MKDAKKLGQYFTPEQIADFMIGLASVDKKAKILEPACGEGVFLRLLNDRGYKNTIGYEIDKSIKLKTDTRVLFESFVSAKISEQFDLIIGNPPYIRWKNLDDNLKSELEGNLLWQRYFNSLCDYLCIFVLKSVELLKEGGELIFITPEYWINTKHASVLRDYLVKNGYFTDIVHFNETPIFDKVASSILIFKYVKSSTQKTIPIQIVKYHSTQRLTKDILKKITRKEEDDKLEFFDRPQFQVGERWTLAPKHIEKSMEAFEEKCTILNSGTLIAGKNRYLTLGDIANIGNGMVSGLDKAFQIPSEVELTKEEKKSILKVLKAKNIERYTHGDFHRYIFLNGEVKNEDDLKEKYPTFYSLLNQFKDKLGKRYNYNRKINYWDWVFLRSFNLFNQPQERIFVPCKERISHKDYFRFSYVDSGVFPTQDVTAIFLKPLNRLSNNQFLAYVRVSSKDQNRGQSLDEQKARIEEYARRNSLVIIQFYGEVESASKVGREIFDEMIKRLKKDRLGGLIFHKTDRSARNPRDQALLYELVQEGYQLHFVTEGISTTEPAGRNLMYIMWGLASGYSENLKAEINKGVIGRLKQGRWPLQSPVGYMRIGDIKDCTKGIDPIKGPMIRKLFEEYATGRYSVQELGPLSQKIGLTNNNGGSLGRDSLHNILRNPFYYGLLKHKYGVFPAEHEPLFSKALFDKVQYVLKEKGFKKSREFGYSFKGLLKCQVCGRRMKATTAKGTYKYYHCRDWNCGVKTVAEIKLEADFLQALKELTFTDEEVYMFKLAINTFRGTVQKSQTDMATSHALEIKSIKARLDGLFQKYMEQKVDDETYNKARTQLLNREIELKEQIAALEKTDGKAFNEMDELVKLLKNPAQAYEKADPVNKRRLLISMVANLTLHDKTLVVTWKKHFELVANRPKLNSSGSGRNRTAV